MKINITLFFTMISILASVERIKAQSSISIEQNTTTLNLSWLGESNVTYAIQYSPNITNVTWTNSNSFSTGNGSTIQIPVTNILGTPLPVKTFFRLTMQYPDNTDKQYLDILTPQFYNSASNDSFRIEVNKLIYYAQTILHHPLANSIGQIPSFSVPLPGRFGAGKGIDGTSQYHPAVDLYIGNDETNVELFADQAGYVATYTNSSKYRHYLAISNNITASNGDIIGKIVTIYAHIDLDLDHADSIFMDGQYVNKGDLISKNLYAGTVGGPHLHFEIRYYRPADNGDEEFYSFGGDEFTEPGVEPWPYGYWNPNFAYGYGDPKNHGLIFY